MAYLHQKLEIDIVRLWRGALGPLVTAAGDQVDTLPRERTGDGSDRVHGYIDHRRQGRPGDMLPWRRRRRRGGF